MSSYYSIRLEIAFAIFLITAISSGIIAVQMRRRIRRDLGRKAKDSDLASIETWMNVDEVEQKKNPGREWVAQSFDLTPESDLIPEDEKPIDLFTDQNAKDRE